MASNAFDNQSNGNLRCMLNIVDNVDQLEDTKDHGMESEMVCDNTNDKCKQQSNEGKGDIRPQGTAKSVLNILNNKSDTVEKLEPSIWECKGPIPPDMDIKAEEKKVSPSESINCVNVKHNTNLYDPAKLNKGHYLEVKFKNDLIFDLDM